MLLPISLCLRASHSGPGSTGKTELVLCFNEDALEGVERERRRIERRKRGRDAEEIPEVRIG